MKLPMAPTSPATQPLELYDVRALSEEVRALAKERDAVILAHNYQVPEIQDVADYVGDSLGLSRQAAAAEASVIAFCGVHFMAETAKILNPDKTVIVPDMNAGCSLADACPPEQLAAWKAKHPEYKVVAYINCSAGVKALCDIICTSSNAERVVRSFPADTPILFVPDRNLGGYLMKKLNRPMKLWQGTCIVHETFSERKIVDLKVAHPEAEFIAHPECEPTVLRHADFIGSTSALLGYVSKSPKQAFIVGTETGILHQMKKAAPTKTFIAGPFEGEDKCACNQCPHMKLNTLEKLWLCLKTLKPTLEMSPELIAQAKIPLERMLALG